MSKIAYDLSKIKAIAFDVDGVLSTSTIPLGDNGIPRRTVNIKDGYALQLAVKRGIKVAIITGAVSPGITERFEGLGVKDIFCGAGWKHLGDHIPDYECMVHCGLAVAPADAAADILRIAGYISPVNGGCGVARDLLEELLRAQGKWALDDKAFGW